MPSFAGGVRAGIREIAPVLIGLNPLEIRYINSVMDEKLNGHPYIKSAIDMACWDLSGKVCNSNATSCVRIVLDDPKFSDRC